MSIRALSGGKPTDPNIPHIPRPRRSTNHSSTLCSQLIVGSQKGEVLISSAGKRVEPLVGRRGDCGRWKAVPESAKRDQEYTRGSPDDLGATWCAPRLTGQVAGCAKH